MKFNCCLFAQDEDYFFYQDQIVSIMEKKGILKDISMTINKNFSFCKDPGRLGFTH